MQQSALSINSSTIQNSINNTLVIVIEKILSKQSQDKLLYSASVLIYPIGKFSIVIIEICVDTYTVNTFLFSFMNILYTIQFSSHFLMGNDIPMPALQDKEHE